LGVAAASLLPTEKLRETGAMPGNVYLRLREHLDQMPIGYPSTESGVEIEILRLLFKEEEARTTLLLTPFPEEPEQIAARCDEDTATDQWEA
jgi:hypothetical protein